MDDGDAVVHLHKDTLGSLVMATGATGLVIGARSFYPSGLERESSGFVDTYGFTGQEQEAASGLLHFGFRDLDPLTGRWDASDPSFAVLTDKNVGAQGEATTGYAYVGNDLMDHVDPTGLGLVSRAVSSLGRKILRSGLAGKRLKTASKRTRMLKRRDKIFANNGVQGNPNAEALADLRADPLTKASVEAHFAKSFASENLKFIDAVNEFAQHAQSSDKLPLAAAIMTNFIGTTAVTPVNISSESTLELTTRNTIGGTQWLSKLQEAKAAVANLAASDVLKRWKP